MRRVYKYEVMTTGDTVVPARAKLVHFAVIDLRAYAWFEIDDQEEHRVARRLQVIPTGGAIPTGGIHVGTTIDGPLVWHLYEFI